MFKKYLMLVASISALGVAQACAQGAPVTIAKNGLGAPVYITNIDAALASYLTKDQAAATYLPLTGGTVQTLAVSTSFTPPSMTYAQATASTCTLGTIYYITDGQKFWSNSSFTGATNSEVLVASDAGQEGGFYGCVPKGTGQVQLLPLDMNYNGGAR